MSKLLSVVVVVALVAVASADVINWVGGSQNSMWNTPENWEGAQVPTRSDDVVINSKPGTTVLVGNIGYCNSLTLGSATGNLQYLNVTSTLQIGAGGAKIMGGSIFTMIAGTLQSAGAVNIMGANGLVFSSGTIQAPVLVAKTGSVWFSGSAQKAIKGNFTAIGNVVFDPSTILLSSGLLAMNTASASGQFFVQGDSASLFASSGSFFYRGQGSTFSLSCPASFAHVDIYSGTLQVLSTLSANNVTFDTSSFVNLLGDASRTIQTATGTGGIIVQGGSNTFSGVISGANVQLKGGVTFFNGASKLSSLALSTGDMSGSGSIAVDKGFIMQGNINGPLNVVFNSLAVAPNNANILMAACAVTVTGAMSITTPSGLFTLTKSATFTVASGSTVSQQSNFRFTSADTTTVVVTNNGVWNVAGGYTFNSMVTTSGSGEWSSDKGGSITFQNVDVAAGTFNLAAQANAYINLGRTNVGSATGAGSIFVNSASAAFQSLSIAVANITAQSMTVSGKSQVGVLYVNSAVDCADDMSAQTFIFVGGSYKGTTLTAFNFSAQQGFMKVFDSVAFTATNVDIDCGSDCTFQFNNGATMGTSTSSA